MHDFGEDDTVIFIKMERKPENTECVKICLPTILGGVLAYRVVCNLRDVNISFVLIF